MYDYNSTAAYRLYFSAGHRPCDLVGLLVSAEMTAFRVEEGQAHMHVHRGQEPRKHHTANTSCHCTTFLLISHIISNNINILSGS